MKDTKATEREIEEAEESSILSGSLGGKVGFTVGVEGLLVGVKVGLEGLLVGLEVGLEGLLVGFTVGVEVGLEGLLVGFTVGEEVGLEGLLVGLLIEEEVEPMGPHLMLPKVTLAEGCWAITLAGTPDVVGQSPLQ